MTHESRWLTIRFPRISEPNFNYRVETVVFVNRTRDSVRAKRGRRGGRVAAFVDRAFTTSSVRVLSARFHSSLFNFYANLLTITEYGFTSGTISSLWQRSISDKLRLRSFDATLYRNWSFHHSNFPDSIVFRGLAALSYLPIARY